MEILGEISADMVIDLIAHHLHGLRLQEQFRETVAPPLPRRPLAKTTVVPLALQDARRAQRRRNSARRKT